ncbi:Histidine phosphatase superfamily (branch 2) [Popillia japonica]|uniref:acid phosphatase n=1 Tax=Popillia japonica TaxID=7064 RepID=A0AAW1HV16_POPJA
MLIKLRKYKFSQHWGNRYTRTMTDTLVLLQVVFRHGDRTPEKNAIYPTDPHKDYDYSPVGYGQLTNDGKRRSYRFGQSLRERYGHFLNDMYKTDEVTAWTSDYDRTKMTLQLVLASLYPPKEEQLWHDNIPWQPIPYNCVPKKDDRMFLAFYYNQIAVDEYNRQIHGEWKEKLQSYQELVDYVQKHSGRVIASPRIMFALACTLTAEEKLGFQLPNWTKEVWPDKIEEYSMREFDITSSNKRLQSLTIGGLLQKIVDESVSKVENGSNKQLHLYSAHDFTVGMILKILNIFDGRHPDYCANVAFELHKIDGVYGFKIKYQIGENEEPKLMEIPNVGTFWPLEEFIEYYKEVLEDRPYD